MIQHSARGKLVLSNDDNKIDHQHFLHSLINMLNPICLICSKKEV